MNEIKAPALNEYISLNFGFTSSLFSRLSTSIGSSFILVTMANAARSWLSAKLMTPVAAGRQTEGFAHWMVRPFTATFVNS